MPILDFSYVRNLEKLRTIYPDNTDSEIRSMSLSELLYQSTRPSPDRRPKLEAPMVLIEIRNPQGVQDRCDANCYDSTEENCYCCCGGANHGVGLSAALANLSSIVQNQIPTLWIKNHERHLPPACSAYVQLPLWFNVPASNVITELAENLKTPWEPYHSKLGSSPPESEGTE